MRTLVELVKKHGKASALDLLPHVDLTREQVLKGLQKAKLAGRLEIVGKVKEDKHGGRYAIYRAVPQDSDPPVRRVSSVWELGA